MMMWPGYVEIPIGVERYGRRGDGSGHGHLFLEEQKRVIVRHFDARLFIIALVHFDVGDFAEPFEQQF